MKMTSEMALDTALTILTKHYENEYEDYYRARTLAYAYLFGALSISISNKKATEILEVVFNTYSPKEKVGA